MHDLLALLELALGTLHKADLEITAEKGGNIVADRVIVLAATEGTAEARDVAIGLVNGDDISGTDFLLRNCVDHLNCEKEAMCILLCLIHIQSPYLLFLM